MKEQHYRYGTRINGYQNGVCFNCDESIEIDDIHVDHVVPRQFVYHDEVWNLVLAHSFCNQQKAIHYRVDSMSIS